MFISSVFIFIIIAGESNEMDVIHNKSGFPMNNSVSVITLEFRNMSIDLKLLVINLISYGFLNEIFKERGSMVFKDEECCPFVYNNHLLKCHFHYYWNSPY